MGWVGEISLGGWVEQTLPLSTSEHRFGLQTDSLCSSSSMSRDAHILALRLGAADPLFFILLNLSDLDLLKALENFFCSLNLLHGVLCFTTFSGTSNRVFLAIFSFNASTRNLISNCCDNFVV